MGLVRTKTGQVDTLGRPIWNVTVVDKDGVRIDDPSLTPEERADETRFHPVVAQLQHARGDVTLVDGTVYNVDPDVIEAQSKAHAQEISHHVGVMHEQDGHPAHTPRGFRHPDTPAASYHPLRDEFIHICDPQCGPAHRSADEIVAAFNKRLEDLGHSQLIGSTQRPEGLEDHVLSHSEVVAKIQAAHAARNEVEAAPTSEMTGPVG